MLKVENAVGPSLITRSTVAFSECITIGSLVVNAIITFIALYNPASKCLTERKRRMFCFKKVASSQHFVG